MRTLTSYFFAILFLVSSANAQSGGTLEFDAVAYRLDESKAQVEFYYGAIYRSLNFKQSSKGWTAAIVARAEIRENGKVIASQDISKDVNFTGSRADLEKSSAMKVLDGAVLSVPYSNALEAVFVWKSPNASGKVEELIKTVEISIPKPDQQLSLGGLELASDVEEAAGKTSVFERVGYIVTPNPSLVYGDLYTKLYYYTELYVPEKLLDAAKQVEVVTRILDPKGTQLYTNSRMQSISQPILPIIGQVDVDGLPSDRYTLEVAVRQNGNLEAVSKKNFFYDSGIEFSGEEEAAPTELQDEEAVFASSEINRMSETELNDRIGQAKIIAPQADIKTLETAKTPDDKRQYLYAFWRARDGKGAPLSAFAAYYKRVDEIDKKYRIMKTPGWKTDRGRVLLKYGDFSAEELKPHTRQSKPYIVWDYTMLRVRLTSGSTAEFVFVDRQGGGNYVLVHSNVLGEVSNPDWYNQEALQMN